MIVSPISIEEAISAGGKSLLLLADPGWHQITSYLKDANILVAKEGENLIEIAVLIKIENGFELKNIAIDKNHQGKGIGKKLVAEIIKLAQELDGKTLFVGTGNSSISQLAFYQKCGFRFDHIIRNFFDNYPAPIFENGIQCRDLVMLKMELN